MKSRFTVILMALAVVTMIAAGTGYAGREGATGPAQGRGHGGFLDQLTEEQRDAVHEKIREMRDTGADREEIRAAVHEMLEGWGIEPPERPRRGGEGRDREGMHHPPFFEQLSEEQIGAVRNKVREMRDAGASHEEIRTTVHEMLAAWGVEVPERPSGERGHRRGIFRQLTEEQRTAVRDVMRGMRDAGASREEVHAAVRKMLEGFGIELPESGTGEPSPEVLKGENAESATWGRIKSSFK